MEEWRRSGGGAEKWRSGGRRSGGAEKWRSERHERPPPQPAPRPRTSTIAAPTASTTSATNRHEQAQPPPQLAPRRTNPSPFPSARLNATRHDAARHTLRGTAPCSASRPVVAGSQTPSQGPSIVGALVRASSGVCGACLPSSRLVPQSRAFPSSRLAPQSPATHAHRATRLSSLRALPPTSLQRPPGAGVCAHLRAGRQAGRQAGSVEQAGGGVGICVAVPCRSFHSIPSGRGVPRSGAAAQAYGPRFSSARGDRGYGERGKGNEAVWGRAKVGEYGVGGS